MIESNEFKKELIRLICFWFSFFCFNSDWDGGDGWDDGYGGYDGYCYSLCLNFLVDLR